MRSHLTQAYFPYRCSPCGIVSVNIAADELACPRNKKHKLSRIAGSQSQRIESERTHQRGSYGVMMWFLELFGARKRPRPDRLAEIPRVVSQWGDHELYDQPYECPYCKKQALRFEATGMRFD